MSNLAMIGDVFLTNPYMYISMLQTYMKAYVINKMPPFIGSSRVLESLMYIR